MTVITTWGFGRRWHMRLLFLLSVTFVLLGSGAGLATALPVVAVAPDMVTTTATCAHRVPVDNKGTVRGVASERASSTPIFFVPPVSGTAAADPVHAYDAVATAYDAPSRLSLVARHELAVVVGTDHPSRADRGAVTDVSGSVVVSGFVVAAKAAPGVNGALRDAATGRFAANPATATAARSSSVHGNSLASSVPTTLYRRVTSGGDFQKWGISGNLKGRYTSTEVGTDQLIPMTSGGRSDMVNLERWLVRNDPGPMNLEPWAGR